MEKIKYQIQVKILELSPSGLIPILQHVMQWLTGDVMTQPAIPFYILFNVKRKRAWI